MRIYFDACTINRLTDDSSQQRIHDEARAVEFVLRLVADGSAEMAASTALRLELRRNPDSEKRSDSMRVLSHAGDLIELLFDGLHEPGTRAVYPGIYRCAGCGREIATAAQHVLPPQTHHAHRLNEGKIRWQLVVSHS